MNNVIKIGLIVTLFCIISEGRSESECSFIKSVDEKPSAFRRVLSKTKNVRIVQKVSGTTKVFTSEYEHEFVNLNGFDLILLTKSESRKKQQFHGINHHIYFGLDIINEELDLFFFVPTLGLDTDFLLASFKYNDFSQPCTLKSKIYADRHYVLLKITSQSTFTIDFYNKDTDTKTEGDPSYAFY